MTAFAFYLLKVFVCSGLLFLYYLLALKDKAFHQWNRFYLLSAVALSLALPLVQIAVMPADDRSKAIQVLQAVQSADDYMEAITVSSGPHLSVNQWLTAGYAVVCFLILTGTVLSVIKIKRLVKKWGVQTVENIRFVNTLEPGTPFSFLRYIFWHKSISLASEGGRRIFRHEMVHVNEKHTLDKLFLQAVLAAFWCNPFFWLIKKELRFIHEFIADKESVGETGTAAFAAMILQAAYPSHYSSLVNPFFQKSIKRRLAMLTKKQNPRLNYTSRIVALPLMAFLAFAFTVRTKARESAVKLEKEFVVVIDAAHGYKNGRPSGAQLNGLSEDDLVLQLTNKIKALNTNRNLKLVLTRSDENLIGLPERVAIAKNAAADLFISVHVNTAQNETDNGIEIYLPSANKPHAVQDRVLASAIIAGLGSVYTVAAHPLQRKNSVYVLDYSPCPAVLVEFGYLTSEKDRTFFQSEQNQERIATQLLKAIENYAARSATDYAPLNGQDTLPRRQNDIVSVDVNKAKGLLTVYYADGSCETMTEQEADKRGLVNNGGYGNVARSNPAVKNSIQNADVKLRIKGPTPLFVIDNIEAPAEQAGKLDPNTIASIDVLKGDTAVVLYGEKGKNGVVEITTKAYNAATPGAQPLYFLDGKEIDAKKMNAINPATIESVNILKGPSAIERYGERAKNGVVLIKSKETANRELTTFRMNDTVQAKARITHFQVQDSGRVNLSGDVVTVKGKPLLRNSSETAAAEGKPVNGNGNEPVTVVGRPLQNTTNNAAPVFTQAETPAKFDHEESQKWYNAYMRPVFNDFNQKAAPGRYTVKMKFVVNANGSLSNITALNDPGFGVASKMVEAYKHAQWQPATQNGHPVASEVVLPSTLIVDAKPQNE